MKSWPQTAQISAILFGFAQPVVKRAVVFSRFSLRHIRQLPPDGYLPCRRNRRHRDLFTCRVPPFSSSLRGSVPAGLARWANLTGHPQVPLHFELGNAYWTQKWAQSLHLQVIPSVGGGAVAVNWMRLLEHLGQDFVWVVLTGSGLISSIMGDPLFLFSNGPLRLFERSRGAVRL
jgi:hypothetical protein